MPRVPTIGDPLRIYRCFDFSGGLDVNTSAPKLALSKGQKWLGESTNTVYNNDGAVTKRFDTAVFNHVDNLGAGVAITGGIHYRTSTGLQEIVVGTTDGRIVRLNLDGTTTNLASGLSRARRWSFAIFNDELICCNGVDAPRLYDGTTVALLGGSPPALGSVAVSHRNRVWMLDNEHKSRLSWSALNNHEDWTTTSNAGFNYVNPKDGQSCTGLLSLLGGELIVTKHNALYRVQGSTYDDISTVPVSAGSNVGNVSFQSLVQAGNDAFFVSSHGIHTLAGVVQFGDLREAFITNRIDPYFTPNTEFTVRLELLDNSRAVYDRQNRRLMFSVAVEA